MKDEYLATNADGEEIDRRTGERVSRPVYRGENEEFGEIIVYIVLLTLMLVTTVILVFLLPIFLSIIVLGLFFGSITEKEWKVNLIILVLWVASFWIVSWGYKEWDWLWKSVNSGFIPIILPGSFTRGAYNFYSNFRIIAIVLSVGLLILGALWPRVVANRD